jgi:hypothetical protein
MILIEKIAALGQISSSVTLFRRVLKLEKYVRRKTVVKISYFEPLLIF